jgi:hypothetical protein
MIFRTNGQRHRDIDQEFGGVGHAIRSTVVFSCAATVDDAREHGIDADARGRVVESGFW